MDKVYRTFDDIEDPRLRFTIEGLADL